MTLEINLVSYSESSDTDNEVICINESTKTKNLKNLKSEKSTPLKKKFSRPRSRQSKEIIPATLTLTATTCKSSKTASNSSIFSSTDEDESSSEEDDSILNLVVTRRVPKKFETRKYEEIMTEPSDSSDISSNQEEISEEETEPCQKEPIIKEVDPIKPIQSKLKFKNSKNQNLVDPFDLTKLTEILSLNDPKVVNQIKSSPLQEIGVINAIFEGFITIQGIKNKQILDVKTCLFFNPNDHENESLTDCLLGLIFDVYGKVDEPCYIVRLRSTDLTNIKSKIVLNETKVYFAPHGNKSLKSYVKVHQLMNDKFTDASWEEDKECPLQHLDFSDDEEERNFKKKNLKRSRGKANQIEEKASTTPTATVGVTPKTENCTNSENKNSDQNSTNDNTNEPLLPSPSPNPVRQVRTVDPKTLEKQEELLKKQNDYIDKLAEEQMKMLQEMEQNSKEEQEFKRFFYGNQNQYIKQNGNGNYIKNGRVQRFPQNMVKNHFASEKDGDNNANNGLEGGVNSMCVPETGSDYVEEMKRMNPGFTDGPDELVKTQDFDEFGH